jgi:alkanesulfonate monooxygenase SsuD/methylene tetrahydromethanopterin reductase-like flavin-dependent oxidoreductase (luciferase family)
VTQRGLFVPPFDALADPRVVADLAVDAEAAGWDGFFVWDHLLYAEPVRSIADPWICCAAVAARTSRMVLGPMVTPLSRRRPHVLARQAASLDLLSGGRLVLGFGLGDDGSVGELSRFGEETDAKTRAAMLDEGLDLLAGLLSGDRVQHECAPAASGPVGRVVRDRDRGAGRRPGGARSPGRAAVVEQPRGSERPRGPDPAG